LLTLYFILGRQIMEREVNTGLIIMV
jgi:hypothetical protein